MTKFQFDGYPEEIPGLVFKVIQEEGPGGGLPVVEVSGERSDVVRYAILLSFTPGEVCEKTASEIMSEVELYIEDVTISEIEVAITQIN